MTNYIERASETELKSVANETSSQDDRSYSASASSPTHIHSRAIAQRIENKTGLPNTLKMGIERLSGFPMDDVKVHYNSSKPAQFQAKAYTQGTQIHLEPGQKKHLPHEAWHMVQQKQGRLKPTMQMKGGVNVNDNVGLEKEADVMGAKALQMQPRDNKSKAVVNSVTQKKSNGKQGFGFVDNRPEVVAQSQHLAPNSDFPHQVIQLTQGSGGNSKKKAKKAKKPGETRTYVIPLQGTTHLKPPGGGSWLQHHGSGSPGNWGKCCIEGCDEMASKGAHVQIHSKVPEKKGMAARSGKVSGGMGPSAANRFVIPTCSYHNSKKHDKYKLLTKKNKHLVSVGKSKKKKKT